VLDQILIAQKVLFWNRKYGFGNDANHELTSA